MKNIYVLPEMEIVLLSNEDVIATSIGEAPSNLGSGNEFEWGDLT